MGTGFIILQLGAPFIAFGFFYLLYFERTREHSTWKSLGAKLILFIAGACLPLAAVCAAMLMAGVFDTFFFWTYAYAREYVSLISPMEGLLSLHFTASLITKTLWLPWALAMIGLLGLLGKRFDQNARFFSLSFFIFSFLSICPGFYFREHYFVLVLPAIALLSGIGVETLIAAISRNIDGRISLPVTVIFVLIVALSSVFQERTALLEMPPVRLARLVYGVNPFPESVEIARYVRERSSSDDRIAVIGSEPQIYFYSRRRAATGYLYTYPLMENHRFARRMQEQMIQQIESASPRYLVFVNVPTSWLPRPQSERLILNWFNHYQEQYYRVVGVIDIISEETTEFRWDGNAEGYVPKSSCWLKVFERL